MRSTKLLQIPEPGLATTRQKDAEDRRQQRLRRLGTQHPSCAACGESDPTVLELHHIAGQEHHDDVAVVCANDHRRLSDRQRDHLSPGQVRAEGQSARMGHYLLGLADLFAMTADTLREFGESLIADSKQRD
jgi:hypothetical protein